MKKTRNSLKIEPKTLAVDILFDVIGCVLYGAGIYSFAYTSHFAPGGVSGLAILLNSLTRGLSICPDGIPIGFATLLINVPIVIFCFKALGLAYFFRSLKTMIFSALIVDYLMPHLWTYQGNPILAAVFGGVLAGAGLSCIYMRSSSTGGSDFVILAIQKTNPHLSIGMVSLIVDGVVILLGGIVYESVDAALYGLMMTITYSLIIDKIMLGNDSRKLLTVITDNGEAVAKHVLEEADRGVTLLSGRGAYTGVEKEVLLCACSNAEVYRIRRIVYGVDKHAFIMISSIDAAYGEGFKPME